MAVTVEIWMKRNDTRPSFVVQLRENIGLPTERPIDLRESTEINFMIRNVTAPDVGAPVFKRPMAILYPLAAPGDADYEEKGGWVQYDWEDDDLAAMGDYNMEAEITWAPGATETIPNKDYWLLHVEADLG
jgi:hypothetical protein